MPNKPKDFITHGFMASRVKGIREYAPPGALKTYKVVLDERGNIKRDQAGNPVLGKEKI